MSKSDFATTTEAVSPETMIKRVFGVARLLAAAKYQRDAEDQVAENPVKKQRQDELRYRENDLTTHTV
ncbi:MAG: hypothetical protein IPK17_12890 [Chloroflexi bacterium]|uniref:hypothetical protein n=1 Tax=Candidatus Flexifilum breve TaxID=3140694 RepID=UPI00313636F6|nr:hypothetical protein [Chloroflexota bacterium]